jgi:hypothetical protein
MVISYNFSCFDHKVPFKLDHENGFLMRSYLAFGEVVSITTATTTATAAAGASLLQTRKCNSDFIVCVR